MSAAIALGVGSLAAGLLNNFLGQQMSEDLMDYQYKLQQQAIDKQNLYNSPVEQMKRLQAAGLNPNLVYGNGVDGNQSSAASPSIANRSSQLGNPLQDAYSAYIQEKAMQMQEIKTRNEAFESVDRRHKLQAETLGQLIDNSFNSKTLNTRVNKLSQDLINSIQHENNLIADEALTWSRTRNEDNKLEQIWAETDLLKSRKNLTDEQALTESVRRESLRAGIRVSNAQLKQIAAYIEFLGAGTALRKGQRKIQIDEEYAHKKYNEFLKNHPNIAFTFDMAKQLLGIGSQISDLIP